MNKDDFFIGWQEKMPYSYARLIRRFLFFLLAIVLCCALLIGYLQKKFDTGKFEFGQLTEITGIYSGYPVPSLITAGGIDFFGNRPQITIPLLGVGKFGADHVIRGLEQIAGTSLEKKVVTLKGTLLYNDGKLFMQIDASDRPLVKIRGNDGKAQALLRKELGTISLKGEVVDPKCYFGVMKPGQGKTHKDCAIRCILGGIPPVLRTEDESGAKSYYLILGPNGERLNKELQDFTAEPVKIYAKAVQYNDWIILYTNPTDVQPISRRELLYNGSDAVACVRDLGK